MAWTEQAWRYSLAGIPDPAKPLDDLQMRTAFAGVPVAGNVLAGAQLWDYDESLSLQGIPLPDSGFEVTTRYAIANVPAVDLSDGTARDGLISATLATLTVDFDGTRTIPTIDGDLTVTLESLNASFVGEFGERLYFDVEFSITPAFSFSEEPARFGDLDATLGGLTSAFTGTFRPVDAIDGDLSATLATITADFDGTFVAPAGRTGDISADLSDITTSLRGVATGPETILGAVQANLGGLTVNFDGIAFPSDTGGLFTLPLEPVALSFAGSNLGLGTSNGVISLTLDGLTVSFISDRPAPVYTKSLAGKFQNAALSGKFSVATLEGKFR